MPVAKICSGGTLNAMKSEEGNDPLDAFIRQAIGKEPLLPFSRTADSPVQWIQLLHALDQPDLPGWPLLTPLKVQMQKCEKCSREFCSPINYRRHIRVHRRSLNIKKEYQKTRDLLAAFWDKLSLENAKEAVSFDNVMLKEIPGSSVVRALASSLRKPAVWTLPTAYVKAGSALLDIIQAKPSRLPISSPELFSILDDASERTFLCAGTAESVQKYVFDGETAKNSLELKNLVASTCFLFEQQLVKAWIADKDAEALRCQKLLVEEEEAAQKRQAALLEKKKLKKLHQKEQKVREQFYLSNGDLNVSVDAVDRPDSSEASGPSSPSDSCFNSPDVPTNLDSGLEFVPSLNKESEEDIEAQLSSAGEHFNQEDCQINEHQMAGGKGHRHLSSNRWPGPKWHRGTRYGFCANHNFQTLKAEALHKLNPMKDQSSLNVNKVWTKKQEVDSEGNSSKQAPVQAEDGHETDDNNCEVIIGSISVTLKSSAEQHEACTDEVQGTCGTQHVMSRKKRASEKVIKPHTIQSGSKQKLWRPVSRGETKSASSVNNGNEEPEGVTTLDKVYDRVLPSETSMQSQPVDDNDNHDNEKQCSDDLGGNLPFSSIAAKKFLAQRWKEAIAEDHVTLVLSSGHEPPGCSHDPCDGNSLTCSVPDLHEQNDILVDQASRNAQVKFRKKPEKSMKTKYILKQKAIA